MMKDRAMWFEDVIIPDGNDYIDDWADPLLNNPTTSFDNTGNGYELALFGHYLSSFLFSLHWQELDIYY